MTNRAVLLLVLCGTFAAGSAVYGQTKPQPAAASNRPLDFSGISAKEIDTILADAAVKNPKVLESLSDPAMRQKQLDNLRQLMAFATQAVKDGMANDPIYKQELENIAAETAAIDYDREINKDKGTMAPLGFVSDERVKAYWTVAGHDADFERFLNAKIAMIRLADPTTASRVLTADEKQQARDIFTKTQIYFADYEAARKKGTLSSASVERVNLHTKLQQAQMLARVYLDKIAGELLATDADIAAYVAAHPEFDVAGKRAAAQKILDRAKAGEDFAKLADEFTEDPGNLGPASERHGGLYKDVPLGRMVKPFEDAALGLREGEIAPTLVESDFGYHIIKLDRKGQNGGTLTYDVRHILISTSVEDPTSPSGMPMPLKDYVRARVEERKEHKKIDELVKANRISVPLDFTVPAAPTATRPAAAAPKKRVRKARH